MNYGTLHKICRMDGSELNLRYICHGMQLLNIGFGERWIRLLIDSPEVIHVPILIIQTSRKLTWCIYLSDGRSHTS